jgi:CBS domain-containing protein
MARRVDEIMNRELFSLRPEEKAADALGDLLALGVHAAPVLRGGKPIGLVGLADLVGQDGDVAACVHGPVVTVRHDTPIGEAARIIGETGLHEIVVIDKVGVAVGIVSSIDVLRGVLGLPASHPASFPHMDPDSGLIWTDDTPLQGERVVVAPEGVGVLVLVTGGAGRSENAVWAEASNAVRSRLLDLLTTPQSAQPALARLLEREGLQLRFRAARTASRADAEKVVARIRESFGARLRPHA